MWSSQVGRKQVLTGMVIVLLEQEGKPKGKHEDVEISIKY